MNLEILCRLGALVLCCTFTLIQSSHHQRRANRYARATQERLLNGATLPKFVTELFIPPVLHDSQGKDASFEIALRQFDQQILPEGYPKTTLWGFGDP